MAFIFINVPAIANTHPVCHFLPWLCSDIPGLGFPLLPQSKTPWAVLLAHGWSEWGAGADTLIRNTAPHTHTQPPGLSPCTPASP